MTTSEDYIGSVAYDCGFRAGQAHAAGLLEAIAGPEAWLDSWAQHVGNCQGGYVCTCGLTRARSELSAAIAAAKGAKP